MKSSFFGRRAEISDKKKKRMKKVYFDLVDDSKSLHPAKVDGVRARVGDAERLEGPNELALELVDDLGVLLGRLRLRLVLFQVFLLGNLLT